MGKENLIVFPLTLHLTVQKGAKSITSGNLTCLWTFRRLNPALNKVEENPIMLKCSRLKPCLVTKCFRLKFQQHKNSFTLHKIGKKQCCGFWFCFVFLFVFFVSNAQGFPALPPCPARCTGAQDNSSTHSCGSIMVAKVEEESALMYLCNYEDISCFSDTVVCLKI